jgi:hypothetical protein
MATVRAIGAVPTRQDRPVEPVTIQTVEVREATR